MEKYPKNRAQTPRYCRTGCYRTVAERSTRSFLPALHGHYKLSSPPSLPSCSHSMHIMQVRLPLFFFCLWQMSISADSTCYWPDGSTVPSHSDYTPCNQTATGVDSACCGSGDPCSANGYCLGSAGYVYRGGCTDINWDADECCPSCRNGTKYFVLDSS